MHKKTRLKLKLNENEKPVVKVGDKVKTGDVLATSQVSKVVEISLAKLLQVKPKDLPKYLLKELPGEVEKGEVIAVKKGLLKLQQVKCPVSGVLDFLDSEAGTLQIQPKNEESQKVRAWFSGVVKGVSDNEVICEVSGLVIKGKSGAGATVSGKLYGIKGDVDLFNLPTEISERIIILRSAKSDMVAKADALGAVAVIAESLEEPTFSLPHLLVDGIEEIMKHDGSPAILHAAEKQLLIIEGEERQSAKR